MTTITTHNSNPTINSPTIIDKIWARLPTIKKIYKSALTALFLCFTTIITITLPCLSIGIGLIFTISTLTIRFINESSYKEQNQYGLDQNIINRAVCSIKKTIKIRKITTLANIVRTVFLLTVISPIGTLICGAVWIFDRILYQYDDYTLELTKKILVEPLTLKRELKQLTDLYPHIFNNDNDNFSTTREKQQQKSELLEKERLNRKVATAYRKIQKNNIQKAWEDLLGQKIFNIEQGIDADPEIFQPLCRLAVVKELEKPITLEENTCPPSLMHRYTGLCEVQNEFSKLTKNEKHLITSKLINPEKPFPKDQKNTKKLSEIMNKIIKLALPMMQEQDFFETPIANGNEWHCIKNFNLTLLASLKYSKIKQCFQKLFYTPAQPDTGYIFPDIPLSPVFS